MVGGVFGPLGTTVPRGVSPREQGGPWAPPPCSVNSSETLSGLCLLFCSVFWDGCWVFCVVFSVSGVGIMLLGLVPFRTRPLLAKVVVVLSFSLVVWLVSTTPFSLFLSLSGAGETQTHFGFGFPLVSLHLGHDLPLQSARPAPHLHQGHRPAPVFFFSPSSLVFLVWVFSGWSGWIVFSGGWCSGGGSLHASGDSTNIRCSCLIFPLSKGEMLSVFFILCFLCLVRRLLPFFAVLLFLGSLFEKFFGSELLLLGVGVGFVFFGGFLPMFLLLFWRFALESVWKNSLDVRSGVFCRFLPFFSS